MEKLRQTRSEKNPQALFRYYRHKLIRMICLCFSGKAEWSASAVDDSNGMFDLVVDLCCLHDCSGAGTCEAKRLAVFDEHGMFDLVVGCVSM